MKMIISPVYYTTRFIKDAGRCSMKCLREIRFLRLQISRRLKIWIDPVSSTIDDLKPPSSSVINDLFILDFDGA
jgi:hypothetical protein